MTYDVQDFFSACVDLYCKLSNTLNRPNVPFVWPHDRVYRKCLRVSTVNVWETVDPDRECREWSHLRSTPTVNESFTVDPYRGSTVNESFTVRPDSYYKINGRPPGPNEKSDITSNLAVQRPSKNYIARVAKTLDHWNTRSPLNNNNNNTSLGLCSCTRGSSSRSSQPLCCPLFGFEPGSPRGFVPGHAATVTVPMMMTMRPLHESFLHVSLCRVQVYI